MSQSGTEGAEGTDTEGPAGLPEASRRGEARFPADRTLRAVLAVATMAMLGLSWPLWVENPDFPRVPFVAGLPDPPVAASWGAFALLLATIAAGVAWRGMLALSAALLAALVALDQHRLQPWAYQYLLLALAFATVPRGRALGLARLFVVALYFHSALSKLDVSFRDELGLLFLKTAARPFGLDPAGWAPLPRAAATLAMPAVEMAIAVGLCFRATRRPALAVAVGMHLSLLAVLGPAGLGHSPNVLVWNVALIVEDLILFGPEPRAVDGGSTAGSTLAAATTFAFMVAAILPFGERAGLFDTWPSFALYASHAERTEVWLPEEGLADLPEAIRRHASGSGGWRRLDLTAWSREVRGVPVYPQARAGNGLAEALAVRYRGARALRVIQRGRAAALSGLRESAEAFGLDAVRRLGDRYALNAHPAGPFLRAAGDRLGARNAPGGADVGRAAPPDRR